MNFQREAKIPSFNDRDERERERVCVQISTSNAMWVNLNTKEKNHPAEQGRVIMPQ